jgi:hypothetical protein
MRITPSLVFTFFVAVIAAGMVYTSRDWPLGTGMFPRSVGVPVLVMSLIQLIMDAYRTMKTTGGQERETGDLQVDWTMSTAEVAARGLEFAGWLLGMFFGILLLGFFITVPAFTLLYLKYQAKEGWTLTLWLTAIMLVFFVGVFDQILHIHWLEPVISGPENFLKSLMPWLG